MWEGKKGMVDGKGVVQDRKWLFQTSLDLTVTPSYQNWTVILDSQRFKPFNHLLQRKYMYSIPLLNYETSKVHRALDKREYLVKIRDNFC